MNEKAMLFKDLPSSTKIMQCTNPQLMENIGRNISGFVKNTWVDKLEEIFDKCLLAKFSQNPTLADFLLGTGDKTIADESSSDYICGIGRYLYDPNILDQKDKWGKNLLGVSPHEN